jgi:hypothetical protein
MRCTALSSPRKASPLSGRVDLGLSSRLFLPSLSSRRDDPSRGAGPLPAQLVEVKLNVVSKSSHPLPDYDQRCIEHNDIKDLGADTICVPAAGRATLSNSGGGFGSFLGPGAGKFWQGDPVKTIRRR